jgi:hypothetical protein
MLHSHADLGSGVHKVCIGNTNQELDYGMLSGLWAPTTARKGDTVLINKFTIQGMTDSQMKEINRCRIYLQVFYTLDIMDLAGNTIEVWAKQGKRQNGKKTE